MKKNHDVELLVGFFCCAAAATYSPVFFVIPLILIAIAFLYSKNKIFKGLGALSLLGMGLYAHYGIKGLYVVVGFIVIIGILYLVNYFIDK